MKAPTKSLSIMRRRRILCFSFAEPWLKLNEVSHIASASDLISTKAFPLSRSFWKFVFACSLTICKFCIITPSFASLVPGVSFKV